VTDHLEAARSALLHGDVILAYDAASEAVATRRDDIEARYLLALALVRSGALQRAQTAIEEMQDVVAATPDAPAGILEDAAALSGRLAKQLALEAQGAERRALAVQAARLYESAADRHGRYFASVNAATMWLVAGDRERSRSLARQTLRLVEAAKTDFRLGGMTGYWSVATEAEAWLILGDVERAQVALTTAANLALHDVASRATTRRQLLLVCNAMGVESEALRVLSIPGVLHFCGHRAVSSDDIAGLTTEEEAQVTVAVREFIESRSFDSAFGSLACGADIIIAEELLRQDVSLSVFLPFSADEFDAVSVRPAGSKWSERFRACLERASSVAIASDSPYTGQAPLFGYTSSIAMGHTLNRAAFLGIDAEQLAVWDGELSEPEAGTSHDVKLWRRTGCASNVVAVRRRPTKARVSRADASVEPWTTGSILFTDLQGFSRLTDQHQRGFVDGVLVPCARVLDSFQAKIKYRNTWGDAIVAIFEDVASAAEAALELQEALSKIDLVALGLPEPLGLRIGGHVGPILPLIDPVRGVPAYWGREITRAARIEPRTPEGEVYVTDAFAALCALECGSDFVCEYVGRVTTAKDFETIRMYCLRRRHPMPGSRI
jgi:hypothetical protein